MSKKPSGVERGYTPIVKTSKLPQPPKGGTAQTTLKTSGQNPKGKSA